MIAALFVYPDGVYATVPACEIWDEKRDARLYPGPWPVVAHPPCARWSLMGLCRGYYDGRDDGCFEAALRAVEKFGGVLEHPAHTLAWKWFHLPPPMEEGWTRTIDGVGWTAAVDQAHYGHPANKPTWLYYVGDADPPALIWGRASKREMSVGRSWGQGRDKGRSGTPEQFADVLVAMARKARPHLIVGPFAIGGCRG